MCFKMRRASIRDFTVVLKLVVGSGEQETVILMLLMVVRFLTHKDLYIKNE